MLLFPRHSLMWNWREGSGFVLDVNIGLFVAVNRKEAGFAELDVTVTSPLGQDLPLEVKSYGNEKECDLIEFCPSLPGSYRFKMTYGGEEIPGKAILTLWCLRP